MGVKPPYGSEAERLEMTKHLTKTILSLDSKDFDLVAVKDLDSITKYNSKVSMISDDTDQSNRTITFGVDTAARRTGVPGNHHAARAYRVHWDSGAGVLYSTAGKSVVWYERVDVVKKRKREKLKHKFVRHKGTRGQSTLQRQATGGQHEQEQGAETDPHLRGRTVAISPR